MIRNTPNSRTTDRGQAYTLEGFIAAFILLIAVLFAVQSVVITPSSGGAVDRTAQAQQQQQVQDALIVAQQENDLSRMLRNVELDGDDFEEFHNQSSGVQGVYSTATFANESTLGAILNQHLDAGQSYNVEVHYQERGDEAEDQNQNPIMLVNQGPPSSTAVTASYTVVLHANQPITSDEDGTLGDIGEADGYISDLEKDSGLYNVVEVRVIVW
ncbi:DUF7288 family protein [Natronosalvus rutilus]|uniref:Uncharacterized protein n=1 Tax=Natronosalvus rutilus TaxID=2953753 RepID=A0A9E7NBX0_9EURY|nr:hypothetical protein [Natronosalvus rutilus]UTF54063.1 hypothetical protein NGM29_01895 [Natronosalvus rutilus]